MELYRILERKWWQFWRNYAIMPFFTDGTVMHPNGPNGRMLSGAASSYKPHYHLRLGAAIRWLSWWDRNTVPHRLFAYSYLHQEWSEVKGLGNPFRTTPTPAPVKTEVVYAQHPDAVDWIGR
jgi:hypothetical protein